MLRTLRVTDFALIDHLVLDIPEGFTVFTGETGAGKSIVLDAIAVVLGAKTHTDMIRTGAETAVVEALFDISEQPLVQEKLHERGLEGEDPDILLVRRVLALKGKGKVWVNGCLCTSAALAQVVEGLVDMCGQHGQQSVLQVENHLKMLDAYGGVETMRQEVAEAFALYRRTVHERTVLETSYQQAQEKADYIRYALEEWEKIQPEPNEEQALEQERKKWVHAERLFQGASYAEAALYSAEDALCDRLSKVQHALTGLLKWDNHVQPVIDSLALSHQHMQESVWTLQKYIQSVEANPERLQHIEERLQALQRFFKKHGGGFEQATLRKHMWEEQLQVLHTIEDRREGMLKAETCAREEVLHKAGMLSRARHQAALGWQKAMEAELRDMDMPHATCQAVVSSDPDHLTEQGFDRVEWYWSANVGEPLRPLVRIVSGGELSRVMLALKRVLGQKDGVSVYVFDEVDSGLGGKAAEAIGKKIKTVSVGHQALVITHLAPVAVHADHHVGVYKETHSDRTVSRAVVLNAEERVEEVARMMDGAQVGGLTREAARGMLMRVHGPVFDKCPTTVRARKR